MSMLNVFQIAGSALAAQSARPNATASIWPMPTTRRRPDGQPHKAKQVVFAARPVAGRLGRGVEGHPGGR